MPYIYKITNLINNKLYIGKTSLSISKRFQEHIKDSKKERNEKRPLYDAINKYGVENFKIEEIEEVENDEIASKREIYWIDKLRTYVGFEDCNGYNATLGGDSKRFYNYEELTNEYLRLGSYKKVCEKYGCDEKTIALACKEKHINTHYKKQIKRIDKNNNIQIYISIAEAARSFSDKNFKTALNNINRALYNHGTAYGFHWKYII